MVLTFSGIVADLREVQFMNAFLPIVTRDFGSSALSSEEQPLKKLSGRTVITSGRTTSVSDSHEPNTLTPRESAAEGSTALTIAEHLINTSFPIFVRLSGRTISLRAEQSANAAAPNVVS